jgi:hypothetical protein
VALEVVVISRAKTEPSEPFFTQGDALSAEKKWAQSLDERGFRVEAGDATPRPRQRAT